MRGVAQLDADCRIKPCRAAAEARDLHANAAFQTALRMASVGNYFKFKYSILKLFRPAPSRLPAERRTCIMALGHKAFFE
jgi:hypothetical protein